MAISRALTLAAALTLPLLAGCAVPADAAPEPLVRAITVAVNPFEAMAEEEPIPNVLRQLAQTTWTYTEQEGGRAVAGLTAAFTGVDGSPVSRPLSDFTSLATLDKGDRVTVTGAAFDSDFSVLSGGATVAERRGLSAPWLEAGGAPLPLAAQAGARASYAFDASGSLGFAVDRFGMSEEADVRDLAVDGALSASGTLALDALPEGDGLRLKLAASLRQSAAFNATASVEQEGQSAPAGVRATGSAQVSGTAGLLFGPDRQLRAAGAGGSVQADGAVLVRAPGSPTYEDMTGGSQHPLVSESFPYTETEIPAEDAGMPADLRALVLRAYGLTLVPGDSFRFEIDASSGGFELRESYDLLVAARQARSVAGAERDALKLNGLFTLSTVLGGSPASKAFAFTQYVDAASLLPLEVQGEFAETLSRADLAGPLEAARAALPALRVPDSVHLQVRLRSSLMLTSLEPGFQTAAAGSLLALSFPLVAAMGGLAQRFAPFGGDSKAVPAGASEGASFQLSSPQPQSMELILLEGEGAPFALEDVGLRVDNNPCTLAPGPAGPGGRLADTGPTPEAWDAGEAILFGDDCGGGALDSGSGHVVYVAIGGITIYAGRVDIA